MRKEHYFTRHPIFRVAVIWIVEALALLLMAWLLDGIRIEGEYKFLTALAIAAVIGLLNALLWPILSYVLLPFAVLTLGLFALVLNGLIIMLASWILPDNFMVASLWTAILASFGITAINIIASTILTIDDDNSWYRNVVRRRAKKVVTAENAHIPGILFLEIDGLSEPVLEKAMAQGFAPTIKRWIEEGNHKLVGWETDLSSQTSASQAGILHGSNYNIPAFRWYDRERKAIVASSNPDEVARLEKEHSDGKGLLADDGVSRGNLFSGDAPNVMTTASTMKDMSRLHVTDFYAYFVNPYNFTRTLLLMFWDIVVEKYQFRKARKNNVTPILGKEKRGGIYPLLRAFTTVIMRELNTYTLVGDIFAGVPSAYATFVGYDEVAHHSGVETHDAFDALYKIDQQFARLESAAETAPRPYHFVILSDHGQSGGSTFKQRYHMTLEDLIRDLADEKFIVSGGGESNEDWGHLNVFLTDAVQNDDSASKRIVSRALKSRMQDGNVVLGPEGEEVETGEDTAETEDQQNLVVLASGNLGVVYSTTIEERLTMEALEFLFPGLLQGLADHEGIGFIMIRSEEHGAVVIGKKGRYYLAEDRIEGENPLAGFGAKAADHLRREDSFPNCPDILVNSFYDPATNEVAAFEELIGCHGGMGGDQTNPFVLYPSELQLDKEHMVGAADVYHQLKAWLTQLQQTEKIAA
ncbi:MAG: phage holin family protein [Chloroflexi bacterium]|nr:phage holin family protein [Chloroflexota bacterium]